MGKTVQVASMGQRRCAYRVLVGKPEGKSRLGRPRRRGEIILKWIFRNWVGGVDWIDLAQDSDMWRIFVTAVMNLRFPYNAGSSLTN